MNPKSLPADPLFPGFEVLDIPTVNTCIRVVHGGRGAPLLLLHGFPQTHAMWHAVAPALAARFHVVCADLRGYGDSGAPPAQPGHAAFSKRAMAADMVAVMASLGHEKFFVAGHDRGGRVAHRMALDHPGAIMRACVMDIAPTRHMFRTTDQAFATGYYHWFFLIQPDGLPERMIGADPDYYLEECLRRWTPPGTRFAPRALAEYLRCFRRSEVIHSACEDYRAAASVDLEHDEADYGHRRVSCPLLVLWGDQGFVHRTYDVLQVWREYASEVSGHAVRSGHFLPEEAPTAVLEALRRFLASEP